MRVGKPPEEKEKKTLIFETHPSSFTTTMNSDALKEGKKRFDPKHELHCYFFSSPFLLLITIRNSVFESCGQQEETTKIPDVGSLPSSLQCY